MRPSSIVLPLVASLLLGWPAPRASACTCTNFPDFDTALARSDAIFLGEVLEVASAPPEYGDVVWATFRVEQHWKGSPPATARVLTASNGGLCGVGFQPGERYLVYAFESAGGSGWGPLPPGELWTHSCWRTHPYWPGDPDLVLLGPTPVATRSWGGVKILYR